MQATRPPLGLGGAYNGNLVFDKNGEQEYILIPEGRILNNNGTYEYEYHLKDHLGSVRVAFVPTVNGKEVVQENAYYPFGATIGDLSYAAPLSNNRYGYTNQEQLNDFDLNWYDYIARNYNPLIGRFNSIDPLAEKYYGISPYAYCANNPLKFVDPTGMAWVEAEDGQITWNKDIKTQKDFDNSGLKGRFLGDMGQAFDDDGNLVTYYSDGTSEKEVLTLKEVSITADKPRSSAGTIMAGTLAISGGLLADDITVIGTVDDILIPAVLIGGTAIAVGVWLYDQMSKSSSKNEKHGDSGRAKTKAEQQIQELERQLQGASGSERVRIKQKIKNVRENAQRKAKGEEHSRGNKR